MPEPKRRFIPSKWEEKKIVKIVRAIRNGWIKTRKQKREEARREDEVYLLWGDDDQARAGRRVGTVFEGTHFTKYCRSTLVSVGSSTGVAQQQQPPPACWGRSV
jgi:hypothetical protein